MIKLNGHIVTPTIFPDKTSQVWKVEGISEVSNHILWNFENEAEVFQVLQLIELLNRTYPNSTVLEMPTMPYARQDKKVSNETTFAGKVFVELINQTGVRVIVNDIHNQALIPNTWINRTVDDKIEFAIKETNSTVICYPDSGAAGRGYLRNRPIMPKVSMYKRRDQLTGTINDLTLFEDEAKLVKGQSVLIVDDLCDGGRTFIEAAKVLYKAGAYDVYLYTTHGLYTKGVEVLREAGIKRIFNYNGEA